MGVPFLMETLPESRMILLLRDLRDVVASFLDAARKGSWQQEQRRAGGSGRKSLADKRPDAVQRRSAKKYLRNIEKARWAYDAHKGPRRYSGVRTEDGHLGDLEVRLLIPRDSRRGVRASPGGGETCLGEHPQGHGGAGEVLLESLSEKLRRGSDPPGERRWWRGSPPSLRKVLHLASSRRTARLVVLLVSSDPGRDNVPKVSCSCCIARDDLQGVKIGI